MVHRFGVMSIFEISLGNAFIKVTSVVKGGERDSNLCISLLAYASIFITSSMETIVH